MNQSRAFLAALALTAAVLACASPLDVLPQQPTADVATLVAQTVQALTPGASLPAETPTAVPSEALNLLPHSMYFLANDSAGLLQVYRLEQDGRTLNQITFEPAKVEFFDLSPLDGSVAYVSNNQLLLVDANGAGRRVLVDGGPPPAEDNFQDRVGLPVWSPDGATIAFAYDGLNFYAVNSGVTNRALENQIDTSAGFPVVRELYSPNRYSPDGNKLLINIGYYEAGTMAIYYPSNGTLVRLHRPDGGLVCCAANWVPDSSGLYVASPTFGMLDSGLWYVDASSGEVTTLLPGAAPDGSYNFADAPIVGPDGRLYFFFANLKEYPSEHTPLDMVRSGLDGVSGRTKLYPETLKNINEILWAPDASFAIAAFALTPDSYQGGQANIAYPDGRPLVKLADYAYQMKWGP